MPVNNAKNTLNEQQPSKSLIYVARDIERALGMRPDRTIFGMDYYIITNAGEYAKEVQKKYPANVFLIEKSGKNENAGGDIFDTQELLAHPETEKIIGKIKQKNSAENSAGFSLLVFKNTLQIETLCKKNNWKLLNPPAAIAEKIENKITQVAWLGDASKYLPPHEIATVSKIAAAGAPQKPLIVQWAHSHTGEGTFLIPSGKAGIKMLAGLKEKFPDREARVTEYVIGPMFTANICINSRDKNNDKKILIGNINYQITGTLPFTDNPFTTVGNDWSLPHTILSERMIEKFDEIARFVGDKMIESGWRGLFGIDCVYDEERDDLHLIEVNARQPAGTTYESELQETFRSALPGLTMFEAHVAALTGAKPDQAAISTNEIIVINDGAQIIERVQKSVSVKKLNETAARLRQKNYTIITYENTKSNSDLLRIQSTRGIMETHNKFNARGKEILDAITLEAAK